MRKAASHSLINLKPFLIMASVIGMLTYSSAVHAAGNTDQITAKSLNGHSCNANEWHFVITQIDQHSNVPATIDVTWSNGGHEVVHTNKYTGKTAHYTTTSHLNSKVSNAYTYI